MKRVKIKKNNEKKKKKAKEIDERKMLKFFRAKRFEEPCPKLEDIPYLTQLSLQL